MLSEARLAVPRAAVLFWLASLPLAASAQAFAVSATAPAHAAVGVPAQANVLVTFAMPVDPMSVDTASFTVRGQSAGVIAGVFSFPAPDQAEFDPDTDFLAGESIEVTLTDAVQSTGGASLLPHVLGFEVAATGCPMQFSYSDSGQQMGGSFSFIAALGDVDDDGDLDAIVANWIAPNRVWLNDGAGVYSGSGQALGGWDSADVALGDVDGDGDLDAWVANYHGQANRVWRNDGSGTYTDTGQVLGSSESAAVVLADVDGDGDLDAFVTNEAGQPNRVWRNDGAGTYTDSGQALGSSESRAAALGDVDGDGDTDAFVANIMQGDRVWLNDGSGTFADSGQSLGLEPSNAVALGDVDGDGDLDACVAVLFQANTVWLNDGMGTFADSGQALGFSATGTVELGDVDGDDDLDIFDANGFGFPQPNGVWLNDGAGVFSDSGLRLGSSDSYGVTLGDLDGDGDLDAFIANGRNEPNSVWQNDSAHPPGCIITSPAAGSGVVGVASVTFDLDACAGTADLTFDYSLDAGLTWSAATATVTSPVANPQLGQPVPSTGLVFEWHTLADGVGLGVPELADLRLTVDDGTGLPGTCTVAQLAVDNPCLSCGDCNGSGTGPDILDALEAAQLAAGLRTPTAEQMACCDVDASQSITVLDALGIARFAAGLPAMLVCP